MGTTDHAQIAAAQLAADLDRLAPQAWERTAVHTETGLVLGA